MDDPEIDPTTALAEQYGYDPEEFADLVDTELMRTRARQEARRRLDEETNPLRPLPPILTLQERLQRPREATTWRIEGWQPSGSRVLLAAQMKAGKSTLVGNLTRALVDGDDWLGVAKVTPVVSKLTILDFEMSENTAEDWLFAQGIQNLDKVNLIAMRGQNDAFNILDPRVRRIWASYLAEHETDYLVLDCLRPVLDALGLDEHRDAGKFLGPFDALLADAGIAEGMVVHHMGHEGTRSRGDSRLRDWPDVEWRLMRENPEPNAPRFIVAYGRDVDIPEHKLIFDKASRHLIGTTGSRTDIQAQQAVALVVQTVGQFGEPVLAPKVCDALRTTYARDTVRQALTIAARRGLLTQSRGAHNALLYAVARTSWAARFGGGYGDDFDEG